MRFSRQRQVASVFPVALAMAVGNRSGGGPLPGFAAAEEGLAGTVDAVNVDAFRTELKRRIDRLPSTLVILVSSRSRAHNSVQLIDCTIAPFDLVDQPIGIDHLTTVDGSQPRAPAAAGRFAVDLHLGGDRTVAARFYIAGKGEAGSRGPASAFGWPAIQNLPAAFANHGPRLRLRLGPL